MALKIILFRFLMITLAQPCQSIGTNWELCQVFVKISLPLYPSTCSTGSHDGCDFCTTQFGTTAHNKSTHYCQCVWDRPWCMSCPCLQKFDAALGCCVVDHVNGRQCNQTQRSVNSMDLWAPPFLKNDVDEQAIYYGYIDDESVSFSYYGCNFLWRFKIFPFFKFSP